MRQVAYKTVDNSLIADSLPAGWITEFTYVDTQPEGSLGPEWIIVDEDQFQTLLAQSNSQSALNTFIEEEKQKDFAKREATIAASEAVSAEQQQLMAEFEAFKAWKASQNQ